jgi:hypothetical protein
MAIKRNLPASASQFGVAFTDVYYRVVTASVSRQRDPAQRHMVMIDLVGYAAQPANEDTREIDFKRFNAPLPQVEAKQGAEFVAKAYAWVMSQPEMSGGVEV